MGEYYTGELNNIIGQAILGVSSFPWDYEENDKRHGVIVDNSTLPEGINGWPYDEGMTIVHEVGHYLGLYHTFQDGCVNGLDVGDYCEDTPAQDDGNNIYICDANLNTCPNEPGNDPVHNYMNYTDDECLIEFTNDQITRVEWALETYKPTLIFGPSGINNINANNLILNLWGTITVSTTIHNEGNYYLGIWDENGTSTPNWNWEEDYTPSSPNIGSQVVYLSVGQNYNFIFNVQPTSQNETLEFWLYKQGWTGLFWPIDIIEQSITSLNDNQNPFIQISSPINGSIVSGNIQINANASDLGSGINRVEFFIDNIPLGEENSFPYSYSWNTQTVQNGNHLIKAIAFDNVGNHSEDIITVDVQNVVQSHDFSITNMQINPPNPGINTNVSITANVINEGTYSEPSGQYIRFYVDGLMNNYITTPAMSSGQSFPVSFNWTSTSGSHNLMIKSFLTGDQNPSNDYQEVPVNVGSSGNLLVDGSAAPTKTFNLIPGTYIDNNLLLENTGYQIINGIVSKFGTQSAWITLLGGSSFTLAAYETQSYQIRITVPSSTSPGNYNAGVRFSYNGGLIVDVNITIHVINSSGGTFEDVLEANSVLIDGTYSQTLYTSKTNFYLDNDPNTSYPTQSDHVPFNLTVDQFNRANRSTWILTATEILQDGSSGMFLKNINKSGHSEIITSSVTNEDYNITEWLISNINTFQIKLTNYTINGADVEWLINSSEIYLDLSVSAWGEQYYIDQSVLDIWEEGWDLGRIYFYVNNVVQNGYLILYNNGNEISQVQVNSNGQKYFIITHSDLTTSNYFTIRGSFSNHTKATISNIKLHIEYFAGDPLLNVNKSLSINNTNLNDNVVVNMSFTNNGTNIANDPYYNDNPLPAGLTLVSGYLENDPGDVNPGETVTASYTIKGTNVGNFNFGATTVTYENPSGSNTYSSTFNAVNLVVNGGNLIVDGQISSNSIQMGEEVTISANVNGSILNNPVTDAQVNCNIIKPDNSQHNFNLVYNQTQQKYIGAFSQTNLSGIYQVDITATRQFYSQGQLTPAMNFNVTNPNANIVAEFTGNPLSGEVALLVQFTDLSISNFTTINSWTWDFGDGGTSNLQNPSHSFLNAGNYIVSLTVSDGILFNSITKSNYINVIEPPPPLTANFSASAITIMEGQTVTFNDLSTGTPTSWEWTFEGGYPSNSNIPDPEVMYISEGTYDVTLTVSDGINSNTKTETNYISALTGVKLDIKGFLEGPFNGTAMNTGLSITGILPFSQPYNENPWLYNGNEQLLSVPNQNIVDWVLVELRESLSTPEMATRKATRAGLLLSNGYIVDLDGASPLAFGVNVNNNLYAVIWHRNHLGIMSQNPLQLAEGIYQYDFSTGANVVYGGSYGHKELNSNTWGMIAGDANSDEQVNSSDKLLWSGNAGESGYQSSDISLDGQVNNKDKADLWQQNLNRSSQVPEALTNLPPNQPFNPSPANGSIGQQLNSILTWLCNDPENDPLTYNVYFGTSNPPDQVSINQQSNTYDPELNINTTYYWRIDATDDHSNSTIGEVWSFTTIQDWQCGSTIIDSDGKIYNTVEIGSQCWMAQNINKGISINGNLSQNNDQVIEKYCYSDNDANCDIFGGFYQWDEAMNYQVQPGATGICPAGWHVPTEVEWCTLTSFIDPTVNCTTVGVTGTVVGLEMKSSSNWDGTNSSGFNALGSGYRSYDLNYYHQGFRTFFWTSMTEGGDNKYNWALESSMNSIYHLYDSKSQGFSVRCIRNSGQSPNAPNNPTPVNGAQNQQINPTLSWSCTDPENDLLFYDIYFGQTNPPLLIAQAQETQTFNPGTIDYNTTYFWKVVAHDDHGNATEGEVWNFTTIQAWQCESLLIDSDGKSYSTVLIGTQCWMAENLNKGVMIDGYLPQNNNPDIEKYCYNDIELNCDVHGGLYQWDEIMNYSNVEGSQGICPNGWHIPTDEDWCILSQFIDPSVNCISTGWTGTDIGIKMKSISGWSQNGNGNNASVFNALPSGTRYNDGTFDDLGENATFWTSLENETTKAWDWGLYFDYNTIGHFNHYNHFGFSVRCLKD